MSRREDRAPDDAKMTEGLFVRDAQVVLADFSGQTVSTFRRTLGEGGTMDLMFSYSIISEKGLAYFFPAIDDYSRSADSESDDGFPGSFAHAIGNQLRIRPEAVFPIRGQVGSLCRYLLAQLGKFDQGEEWARDTAVQLTEILEVLQKNEDA